MKLRLTVLVMVFAGLVNLSAAADEPQLSSRTVINLGVAKAIAAAAAEYAAEKEWTVNIAIVDEGANLVYFERGDGVQVGSIEVAMRKAKTAAAFKRETRIFEEVATGGRTGIVTLPDGLLLEGGVPIVWEGQVLGAVGVSGVKSAQDAEIAKAGIAAVMGKIAGDQ